MVPQYLRLGEQLPEDDGLEEASVETGERAARWLYRMFRLTSSTDRDALEPAFLNFRRRSWRSVNDAKLPEILL
jgi:hypothetical protein